jgi:hypothetical protein
MVYYQQILRYFGSSFKYAIKIYQVNYTIAHVYYTNSRTAYYSRSSKVSVADTFQIHDTHDYFEREPFCVKFSSPKTSMAAFFVFF